MMLPPIHGKLEQNNFFIYTACDTNYFNEFGPTIIRSIKENSEMGIHIHLYNPTPQQVSYCLNEERVSITWESVPLKRFKKAAERWDPEPTEHNEALKYKRTITAMSKSDDKNIQERMQRTYYACARFIRLAKLIKPEHCVLAIDSDAIVRKDIPLLPATKDFYIHHITGKKARFLAGGMYFSGTTEGYEFLQKYAELLELHIYKNSIHWGLDQDVLDVIVPKYNFGQLPISYIDWNMQKDSYIWTAKGTRKELDVFINEKKKYNS